MRTYDSNTSKPRKSDEDIRNEGIVLINNALRARSLSEPLLDSYFCGTADVSSINWACYMMQQSIELILKGLIKYYYEDFREGHLVKYNAQFLMELSGAYDELREIYDILLDLSSSLSVMLYKWESFSRYKELYVNKPQIERVNNILDELIPFIRRHNYVA